MAQTIDTVIVTGQAAAAGPISDLLKRLPPSLIVTPWRSIPGVF
jgi:hypothetical protein